MKLATTQTLFTASLEPHGQRSQRTHMLRQLRNNSHIPPELALRIYANNTSGALTRSLASAHPACFRILGETCFAGIARRYIENTPSESPDLNRYGATFGDFLDEWTATRQQLSDYRYLGDLARLEWLCHTAYYAADDSPFDFKNLSEAGRTTPQTLRFRLSHSLGLLQSEYPVMAIRAANLFEGDAAEVVAGELPERLVVSRPAVQIRVEQVDSMTFKVLAACGAGQTLGEILESAGEQTDSVPESLRGLVQQGWVTGVTVDKAGKPEGL